MQTELSEIERVAGQLGGEIQGFINGLDNKTAERHSSVGFNSSLDLSVQNVIKRAQNIKWDVILSKFNAEALRCEIASLISAVKSPSSHSEFEPHAESVSNFLAVDSGFCSPPVSNAAKRTRELSQKIELLRQNVESTIQPTQKVTNP